MNTEPVMIGAAIKALILFGLAFGLKVTPEQQGAILGVIPVVFALALYIRSKVSPVPAK